MLMHKITISSHLSGAFCLVLQSRSYSYAPSSQDKNHSEICDPSVNKYWGTGSKHSSKKNDGAQFKIARHHIYYDISLKSISVAKETEKIEEQIDKVKIKSKSTESCKTTVRRIGHLLCHVFDLLSVPGCESNKDENTETRYNTVKSRLCTKDVDNRADDETNESHQENRAHFSKIAAGKVTVNRHSSKGTGCDDNCLENRDGIIDKTNQR